ncbi:glycosyl hydrolase family 18 protein [Polaribacter cellanae]|uniref:chitinase n=1 Tax=Polaribacter cellanae TaxID=2818493 RepID=A0A975H8E6_9FLAO|nr:glycosyl hydrolase family 18 protein [Polaribacter cellanae]QTE23969.1 T9SS type A sorting domain-containing protein [Polaribacter cellanae]
MRKLLLCAFLSYMSILQVNAQTQPQHNKKVVGYYAQWSIYARDYNVLDIEADKLTHLLYAFFDTKYNATTDTAYIESLDDYADFQHNESGLHAWDAPVKGNIGDLKLLKEKYPHLKIIISLGGWTKSQAFPDIAKSANARATLSQSMVDFMTKYPWIDGFDLDWEFPVQGGTDGNETINGAAVPAQPHYQDDHKNLVLLLKEMRSVFNANSMQNKSISMAAGNNVNNLLATHVGPGTEATHGMTENVFDFCDFVTFFGYDFGGNWFDKTSYNAPLYGGDHPNDPLNRGAGKPNQVLDGLVSLYLNGLQVPVDKLVMGIPFYGKLFEGVASTGVVPNLPGLYESAPRVNSSACNLPQPPKGTWDAVNCESSGSIEFCDLYQGFGTNKHQYLDANNPMQVSAAAAANGWVRYWDDTAKVPYLYNATTNKFITYDDNQSIDLKVKYALSKNLGGVMIWELSQDARNNSSNSLLKTINNSLQSAEYDLTINFKDSSNNPLQSVVVELKDENNVVLQTLNSDALGQVVFSNKQGNVPYNITYSLSGYAFLPNTISYASLEFNSDKTVNVTGSNQVVSIAGSVKENNVLLTNVDVVLKNTTTGEELSRTTSTDGNFTFNSVIDGNDYTVRAEKDFYSFTELTYTNLSSNKTNQLIEATRSTFTISGKVLAGANPLQGATISISGNNQNYTGTTDALGNYSIANLSAGYDYTVTPSFTSKVLLPANVQVNALNENKVFNFAENLGLIYGTVKNGSTPVAGAKVSLILPWTDSSHPYTNLIATTNSEGKYFYTETQLSGYSAINSLKLNSYENNAVVYLPSDLANLPVPSVATEYNFNSQTAVSPEITINKPNQSTISIAPGNTVDLEALVGLTFNDGTTTISTVTFEVDGVTVANTSTNNVYSAVWTPTNSDIGNSHIFKVTAEDSNGVSKTKTFNFSLVCSGAGCSNVSPSVTLGTPANTTIDQTSGFQNIPITVTVTDSDGTIASVAISIDGNTTAMTAGGNDTYTYNFTPTAYKAYPIVITAVDNKNGSTTINKTLNITNSVTTYIISGTVVTGTNPLQGVTVTISGNGQNYTDITDTSGNYSIANLSAGFDYTVTPSLNNTVLTPASVQVTALSENKVLNFAEEVNTAGTGSIYGVVKNGSTPIQGAKVSLVLPWTDNSHPYVNLIAVTNAQGEYSYTEAQVSGYTTISSLKLNSYENNGVAYLPSNIGNIPMPSTATEYNFNSQPVAPEVTIKQPNQSTINIAPGATVNLEALVGLTFNDGTTSISSVAFEVDGVAVANTNTNDVYSAVWTPGNSDIGNSHVFKVTAEDSNGVSVNETFNFNLVCAGANCPNVSPSVTLSAPTSTTINQNGGFQNIPIAVTVTDSDGTINSVNITINGSTVAMTAGANDIYTYNFTPSAYQAYPIVITAIDNENGSTTINKTLNITNSVFVPLPSGNIVLGYAHSWESASAPFLYFNEIQNKKFNVVMYSFIETEGGNGFTPKLTINSNRYLTNGVFDSKLLKDDINVLRSKGIPVIASIGGQNGHVELRNTAEKNEFVQGIKDIIDEYHFDGVDLDFEGGSMNFGAGALTDFSYQSLTPYPKLKNVVDAFKELKQHYGSNFIMTCAPETFYVQVGHSTYSSIAGSFLPVLHNLRNELDLVMVQLYNTGSVNALDGTAYSQGTPDFLTSMTDMLISGFNVSNSGFSFPGLPASKIMVAIPSCPAAAPAGGYIQPNEATKALDYLRFGTSFAGRNYTLQGSAHPDLRGVMTWSINWDAADCGSADQFANSYSNYFNNNNKSFKKALSVQEQGYDEVKVYPIPFENRLNISSQKNIEAIKIFNVSGTEIFAQDKFEGFLDVSFLSSGVYFLQIQVEGKVFYKKITKQ